MLRRPATLPLRFSLLRFRRQRRRRHALLHRRRLAFLRIRRRRRPRAAGGEFRLALVPEVLGDGIRVAVVEEELLAADEVAFGVHADALNGVAEHLARVAVDVFLAVINEAHFVAGAGGVDFLGFLVEEGVSGVVGWFWEGDGLGSDLLLLRPKRYSMPR